MSQCTLGFASDSMWDFIVNRHSILLLHLDELRHSIMSGRHYYYYASTSSNDLEFRLALNCLCSFWTLKTTSEVVAFPLSALESYLQTDTHTHTHTHTHLYVPIIELGNKFQLQYMFCYFRCVSFIEEWWWSEVSFSIH